MKEASISTMIAWGIAVLLAITFILQGWPKLIGETEAINSFIQWGYEKSFVSIIGIVEIVAAILILIPRVSFIGSLVVMVVMIGAIYTHLTTDIGSPTFAVILFLFAVVLAALRFRDTVFIGKGKDQG